LPWVPEVIPPQLGFELELGEPLISFELRKKERPKAMGGPAMVFGGAVSKRTEFVLVIE
jgi:hypothetical protein